MDTASVLFVLIIFVVGVLLIMEVRPYEWRKSRQEEDPDREAQRAQLREAHRIRRQRDKVWFKIDNLYTEFVNKTATEKPALIEKAMQSSSHASKVDPAADSWNEVTLAYIKDKYESFLRK